MKGRLLQIFIITEITVEAVRQQLKFLLLTSQNNLFAKTPVKIPFQSKQLI